MQLQAPTGIAKAAYYPSILLGASAGQESTDPATWFSWPSRFWSVGPQLLETVFEGGKRRAQLDQAQALYDADVAGYRQTVLTAFQQVEEFGRAAHLGRRSKRRRSKFT